MITQADLALPPPPHTHTLTEWPITDPCLREPDLRRGRLSSPGKTGSLCRHPSGSRSMAALYGSAHRRVARGVKGSICEAPMS
jgi:hypothetical protein